MDRWARSLATAVRNGRKCVFDLLFNVASGTEPFPETVCSVFLFLNFDDGQTVRTERFLRDNSDILAIAPPQSGNSICIAALRLRRKGTLLMTEFLYYKLIIDGSTECNESAFSERADARQGTVNERT